MDRKVNYTYYFKGYKYDDYTYVSDDCDDGDVEDWIYEEMQRNLDLGNWEYADKEV